jgi:hypothetical protein
MDGKVYLYVALPEDVYCELRLVVPEERLHAALLDAIQTVIQRERCRQLLPSRPDAYARRRVVNH